MPRSAVRIEPAPGQEMSEEDRQRHERMRILGWEFRANTMTGSWHRKSYQPGEYVRVRCSLSIDDAPFRGRIGVVVGRSLPLEGNLRRDVDPVGKRLIDGDMDWLQVKGLIRTSPDGVADIPVWLLRPAHESEWNRQRQSDLARRESLRNKRRANRERRASREQYLKAVEVITEMRARPQQQEQQEQQEGRVEILVDGKWSLLGFIKKVVER